MIHIDELIEENKNNHYKLLALVGNEEGKKREVIDYLIQKGWHVYDVEEVVLKLLKDLPEGKRGLRLGSKLNKWVKEQKNKMILTDVNILFSPELKQVDPVESFRYALRGNNEAVLFLNARYRGDDKVLYSTPDKEDFAEIDLSKIVHCRLSEVVTGGNEQ